MGRVLTIERNLKNRKNVGKFLERTPALPSDYPFLDGLRVSSTARAILENLEPDKTQGGARKCVGAEAVEARLEAEFSSGGEAALHRLRDDFEAMRHRLESANAFKDDDAAILRF